MVKKCCIKTCKSESYAGCGVSFHSFPTKKEINQKWFDVIPESQTITKNSVVCSLHFNPADFYIAKSRRSLNANAVPSIFPVFQIKVTSGPTAQFEQQMPPDPSPGFPQPMIEEIKDESEDPPSDGDTISFYGEQGQIPSLEQSDEDQIIEALVPLSDAPDPLCDVKEEEDFGPEENDGPKAELDFTEEDKGSEEESDGPEEDEDGIVGQLSGTVKEENGMVGVNHAGVIRLMDTMPMRAMLPNMAKQVQRRDPEQSIKNITKRCDEALLKVRHMQQTVARGHTQLRSREQQLERLSCFIREHHGEAVLDDLLGDGHKWDAMSKQRYPEMIKQRDEMIIQLQAQLESLRNGTRDTSVRQNGAVVSCGTVVPTIKIQSINTEERLKKVNRQLLITKHNDRKIPSVDRQNMVQRTSNARQQTSNQGAPDIPQKSLAGVKRKVQVQQKSVVPVTAVIPLIAKKSKSNVRQNPSVVIHPKLDFRQMTPISDIPQTSVSQRTSDVRQNSLVIQIDGMHNTVLQPKLVRLGDNNTELG